MLFLQKVKRPLRLRIKAKKHICVDTIFAKTQKTSFCGDFFALRAHLNFFFKNQDPSLLFYDV